MKTIYVDMDDVVADFDAYARTTLGNKEKHHRWPDHFWNKLRDNPRLYRDLDKTPYADRLVDLCRDIATNEGWNLLFLTAVPHKNDVHWAFYDKVMWAQKHFPDIPVHFGPFSKDKQAHCITGDILIDDRLSNISEWRNAGGIAIHHLDIEKTIKELKELIE